MNFSTVVVIASRYYYGAQQQWASGKCSQWLAEAMTTPSLTPIALTVGSRRHMCSHRCWNYVYNWRGRNEVAELERQHRLYYNNMARLYARRVLETAAASAAVQRVMTDLEAATASPPVDWHNWQRKEWSQELLDSLGDTKLMRLWEATRRLTSLAILAAPIVILYPLSLVSDTVEEWSWRYALWGIEQAGPTYIKLVQWATTRQDLFSPEFCRYFGKLQDKTAGHKWEETLRILQEDLGLQMNQEQLKLHQQNTVKAHERGEGVEMLDVNEYLELDHTPIGSGCIAQVYRGKLKQAVGQFEKGTEVAVKVQHPGIWYKVCVDFYIMGKVAEWLESLPWLNLKYLSISDSVRKFRDIMLPQLDLTLESKHLTRFNRDFANDPSVTFPRPVNDLTSTRVLTETFIRGRPILEYTTASEAVRKELAHAGLEVTLKMIFLHDFLHGDLHPGNILVRRQKTGSGHHMQLCLLDCGLVVEMGPDQHVNLVKILGAFTRKDGRLAGQLMVDTSSDSQASDLDVQLFVSGIEKIVRDDENHNFVEKVGDYIADICYMACRRKVKLESSFINAALAVEIMEGIATALYPQIQVTKAALPLVMQAEVMHRLPKFSLW